VPQHILRFFWFGFLCFKVLVRSSIFSSVFKFFELLRCRLPCPCPGHPEERLCGCPPFFLSRSTFYFLLFPGRFLLWFSELFLLFGNFRPPSWVSRSSPQVSRRVAWKLALPLSLGPTFFWTRLCSGFVPFFRPFLIPSIFLFQLKSRRGRNPLPRFFVSAYNDMKGSVCFRRTPGFFFFTLPDISFSVCFLFPPTFVHSPRGDASLDAPSFG